VRVGLGPWGLHCPHPEPRLHPLLAGLPGGTIQALARLTGHTPMPWSRQEPFGTDPHQPGGIPAPYPTLGSQRQPGNTAWTQGCLFQLYSCVPHIPAKAQTSSPSHRPQGMGLGSQSELGKGLSCRFCQPAVGASPRDHLLTNGRMAEPEPQPGVTRPSPLFTSFPQLHLGAMVRAVGVLVVRASLSKDSPWAPWLPEALGCLGPQLTLQWREDCTPKVPVLVASLAEGRGEETFLGFRLLKAWRDKLSSGPPP
jgi:hypothetical protein